MLQPLCNDLLEMKVELGPTGSDLLLSGFHPPGQKLGRSLSFTVVIVTVLDKLAEAGREDLFPV